MPTFGESRWKVDARSEKVRTGDPTKVMRYFPIVSMLKGMYRYDFELFVTSKFCSINPCVNPFPNPQISLC